LPQPLSDGDSVSTSLQGEGLLKLPCASLRVFRDTQLQLQQISIDGANLAGAKGAALVDTSCTSLRVNNDAAPPEAMVQTRGTIFLIAFDATRHITLLWVLEQSATLQNLRSDGTSDATVIVAAGQWSIVRSRNAPEPVRAEAEMGAILDEMNLRDVYDKVAQILGRQKVAAPAKASPTPPPTATPPPTFTPPPTIPGLTPLPTFTPPAGCPGPATIPFFMVWPGTIFQGEPTTLSWGTVENADYVVIDQGIGVVATPSQRIVTPTTTTTYTMTAIGCGGIWTKQVTVTVKPRGTITPTPPCPGPSVIPFFIASPAKITRGGSSTLSWGAVQNAISVVIDQGVGVVATPSQVVVTPAMTTIYTITAIGCGGVWTGQVTVVVEEVGTVTPTPTCPGPPIIQSFTASPLTITPGGLSTLNWGTVQNASSVTIQPGIGAVSTPGQITVTPAVTTTYTLTATGCGGTRTSAVTIAVSTTVTPITPTPTCPGPPVIESFTASATTITPGGWSALTWGAVQNANSVTIDQAIGAVKAPGQRVVTPTTTTTYTMTATGCGGTRTTAVTIAVVPGGSVSGGVYAADGSGPIANARVDLGGAYRAMTNKSGGFVLNDVVPGKYALTISATGFESRTLPNIQVVAGQKSSLAEIVMYPVPAKSGNVTISPNQCFDLDAGTIVACPGATPQPSSTADFSYYLDLQFGRVIAPQAHSQLALAALTELAASSCYNVTTEQKTITNPDVGRVICFATSNNHLAEIKIKSLSGLGMSFDWAVWNLPR
jgi:hypothetical protein